MIVLTLASLTLLTLGIAGILADRPAHLDGWALFAHILAVSTGFLTLIVLLLI